MRVNNIYTSNINGASVSEVFFRTNHLDNKVSDLETRKKNVEENLAYKDFFQTYFDEKYNPHLDQDSALSSENNICGMLERMADYLINSEESREMSKQEETAYVFVDEYMQKKIAREHTDIKDHTIEGKKNDFELVNIMDSEHVQIVKRPSKRNHILETSISINKEDLLDESEMGDILRDYQLLLDKIDYETFNSKGKKRKLSLQKFLVKNDMINVKKSYKGILPKASNVPSGQHQKDYDYFDFTDFRTVKAFLNIKGDFYESHNLWLTRIDFDDLVDKAGLTQEEYFVLYQLLEGSRPVDIEKDYGIKATRVRRIIIKNISKKIIALGEHYDADDEVIGKRIAKKFKYRDDNLNEIVKREGASN